MKAILEFNLPEEATEHNLALNGRIFHIIISEIDSFLRQKIKYEDQRTVKIQEMRDKIRELIDDYNVSDLI